MSAPVSARPLHELVHPSWAPALGPVEATLAALGVFLRSEVAAGHGYLPEGPHVLRAFEQPLDAVRVLVLGQDPYPTPGHDLGLPAPTSGDLTPWTEQGVLLLNRVLTVRPGTPASHRGRGWEEITGAAIEALVARGGPLVTILWGRDARSLTKTLQPQGIPFIESAHPSPLSAYRGFFGSRPFSRANDLLAAQGASPVDWRLP